MAPALFVLVLEGACLAYASITHQPAGPVYLGLPVLIMGIGAAILMPVVIVSTRQDDGWGWALTSILLSVIALAIGAYLFLSAAFINCHNGC